MKCLLATISSDEIVAFNLRSKYLNLISKGTCVKGLPFQWNVKLLSYLLISEFYLKVIVMNFKKILFGSAVIQSTAANIGLLLLRVYAGLFLAFGHGIKKFPPSEGVVNMVSNRGFPAPEIFAWLSVLTELFGGIFLALGLFTRPVAFFIAVNMLVAAFVGTDSPFGKKELALFYEFAALVFLFIGSTKYGLDYFIKRKV